MVAGAVGAVAATRGRRLGRLRLAALPDASRSSLEGFLAAHVARPAAVTTDGWAGYGGLAAAGWRHEPVNLSATWGDAALRLPAIHLVFSLAKRWLLGPTTARSAEAPAGLSRRVRLSLHRRTAKGISHRFARVVEHAVQLPPTTYRDLVASSP